MNDFFERMGVGMIWPGPDHSRPAGIAEEWGIEYYANDVVVAAYSSREAALRTLEHNRADLKRMNVPELYWPILVSRTVETTVGSWRHHDE